MNKTGKNGHIPHIIHIFPSFGRGGVPIKICHAINHFGTLAKHTIISTNDEYSCEIMVNDDLDVIIDKSHHHMGGSLFGRLIKYRGFLKNKQPDLLITYNWGSVEWALANSFGPIIEHIHVESGFGPDEAAATLLRRDLFRKFAIRNIKYLSIPSHILKVIAQTRWNVDLNKIKYIPNGVDIEKFESQRHSGKIDGFQPDKKDIIIGTIAPLRPEKNISRLINSFGKLADKNCKLIIIGDGVERAKLEKLTDKLNLNDRVTFTGHISSPQMAIGLFDIFAISSDTEQMPNAVNEAMAASLPVVGLSVGDIRHMVSAENKEFIVKAGDDQTFTDALAALCADKTRQKSIGLANLAHVKKHYNKEDMYKKYAKLWGIEVHTTL